MSAFGVSTSTYATGDDWNRDGGTATTAWLPVHADVVYVSSWYDAPAPTEHVFESPRQRRRRLSLEAITRFCKLARQVRLRIVSIWQRPVTVTRVCALSERWRVTA